MLKIGHTRNSRENAPRTAEALEMVKYPFKFFLKVSLKTGRFSGRM